MGENSALGNDFSTRSVTLDKSISRAIQFYTLPFSPLLFPAFSSLILSASRSLSLPRPFEETFPRIRKPRRAYETNSSFLLLELNFIEIGRASRIFIRGYPDRLKAVRARVIGAGRLTGSIGRYFSIVFFIDSSKSVPRVED